MTTRLEGGKERSGRVFASPHGHWWGVAVDYYGGSSWGFSRLMSEVARTKLPVFEIRGCAYLEMLRAEQVRAALEGEVEVVVFLSSSVETSLAQLTRLAARARESGHAVTAYGLDNLFDCCAIPVALLRQMHQAEQRRYSNSAVVMAFNGDATNAGSPLASPWNRDGSPLSDGLYLTESAAFFTRLRLAGGVVEDMTLDIKSKAPLWRTRFMQGKPPGAEVGTHFALCIPSYGAMDLDQRSLVFALENAGMSIIEIHGYPRIDMARSWLAQRALEQGRGVFFLDHDILFHPNEVLRLCEQALESKALVAGAYCMRRSGRNIIGCLDVDPYSKVTFFKGGSTQPAVYTGLGFAAIPADLLDEVAERHQLEPLLSDDLGELVPWFALDCRTGYYAGEDVSFCNRIQDLEIELMLGTETNPQWSTKRATKNKAARIFIDTRTRLAHRGVYDYGIEDVGLIVPRLGTCELTAYETREEAEAGLKSVLEEPLEQRMDMQYGPRCGADGLVAPDPLALGRRGPSSAEEQGLFDVVASSSVKLEQNFFESVESPEDIVATDKRTGETTTRAQLERDWDQAMRRD